MDFLQKIFNNPKKAVYFIVAFLLLFIAYNAFSAAEAGELHLGPTYTGEFNGGASLAFSERLGDKFDVGVMLVSAQTWDEGTDKVGNNGMLYGQYIVKRPENWVPVLPSEMGLGMNYWVRANPPINGCELGFNMSLKYRFGEHFGVGWWHSSNAGTCRPNRGQDILFLSWRF